MDRQLRPLEGYATVEKDVARAYWHRPELLNTYTKLRMVAEFATSYQKNNTVKIQEFTLPFGINRLSAMTGIPRNTLKRHLLKLSADGFIQFTGGPAHGPGVQPTKFRSFVHFREQKGGNEYWSGPHMAQSRPKYGPDKLGYNPHENTGKKPNNSGDSGPKADLEWPGSLEPSYLNKYRYIHVKLAEAKQRNADQHAAMLALLRNLQVEGCGPSYVEFMWLYLDLVPFPGFENKEPTSALHFLMTNFREVWTAASQWSGTNGKGMASKGAGLGALRNIGRPVGGLTFSDDGRVQLTLPDQHS